MATRRIASAQLSGQADPRRDDVPGVSLFEIGLARIETGSRFN